MIKLVKSFLIVSLCLFMGSSNVLLADDSTNNRESMDYDKILIVAHPDDEFLFGYSELMKEEGWFVLVFTNGDNPSRKAEFEAMMKAVKVKNYVMYDFPDEWNNTDWNTELADYLLKKLFAQREEWEMVVTHNELGDYGHAQHGLVNEIVHNAYTGKNLYEFGDLFRLDQQFMMDKSSREEKKKLLEEHYPSQLKGLRTSVWFSKSDVSYLMKVR